MQLHHSSVFLEEAAWLHYPAAGGSQREHQGLPCFTDCHYQGNVVWDPLGFGMLPCILAAPPQYAAQVLPWLCSSYSKTQLDPTVLATDSLRSTLAEPAVLPSGRLAISALLSARFSMSNDTNVFLALSPALYCWLKHSQAPHSLPHFCFTSEQFPSSCLLFFPNTSSKLCECSRQKAAPCHIPTKETAGTLVPVGC